MQGELVDPHESAVRAVRSQNSSANPRSCRCVDLACLAHRETCSTEGRCRGESLKFLPSSAPSRFFPVPILSGLQRKAHSNYREMGRAVHSQEGRCRRGRTCRAWVSLLHYRRARPVLDAHRKYGSNSAVSVCVRKMTDRDVTVGGWPANASALMCA